MPTNVKFINNVNELTFVNSESGGLHSGTYYEFMSSPTIAGLAEADPYLWFDRNVGITDGKTFHFYGSFMLGEIKFKIEVEIKGTYSSSNFWIEVSSEDKYGNKETTGEMSDVGTKDFYVHLALPNGEMLSYELLVDRVSTSGYDDVEITLSPHKQDISDSVHLPTYDGKSEITILDVWGEGRLTCDNLVSGFTNSYNINKRTTPSSCNTDTIPNLIKVSDYTTPTFPVPDGAAQYITVMGAPIVAGVATEMVRVLNPSTGVVIMWDIESADITVWEANMGDDLVYKKDDPLGSPFDEIKMANSGYRIYGFPDIDDKDEL